MAHRPNTLYLNTSGFFYHRANYLANYGSYLKIDTKGMYPYAYTENYPPFLILSSVALYKLSFSNDLLAFLSYFPVIMFVLIAIVGFILLSILFNKYTGLFFVVLFTIMPSAVRVTGKGFYTEEALGIILLICFIYCLIRLKDSIAYLIFGILFLTLFILTWQTFVIVYAALFCILLFSLKDKVLLKRVSILAATPIFLSFVISVVFMGLAYSPFQIIKETFLAFTINEQPNYKIALSRNDLEHTDVKMFLNEYSFFSIFLVLGAIISLKKFSEHKYRAMLILLIFSILSVAIYLKLRYFALPMIVLMSSIGINCLKEFDKSDRKSIILSLVIVFSYLAFMAASALIPRGNPECEVEIEHPQQILANYPYRISFLIKNIGGDPFCDKEYDSTLHAFGGIHIEVENAKILSKKIFSKHTRTSLADRQPQNNISWFEAKFDCLMASRIANLTLDIMPLKKPVKLHYRCWLPDECELEAPKDLIPEYRAAWRNEKCIKRNPTEGEYCKVDVFAGHWQIQKYNCRTKTIV